MTRYPRDPDGMWVRLHKARPKEQCSCLGPRGRWGAVKAKQGLSEGQVGPMIDSDFVRVKTRDPRSRDPGLKHVGGAKA